MPNPALLTGGAVLAGGGGLVDSYMRWFTRKAAGGDVILFYNADNGTTDVENPGADSYNTYFYSELGVTVDSVETILSNGKWVANNPVVIEKIRNAEAVWFGGGDQWLYYDYLENSPLLQALNELINVKRIVIGGTSAGCAIQSEFVFTAEFDTINSEAALKNPYDHRITLRDNLLHNKWLENTVADQHYSDRNRFGRHVAFMARVFEDSLKNRGYLVRGIGVDERTAVCVELNGMAYVYGTQSAFFIQQASLSGGPERCEADKPLDWNRNKQALNVYKVQADDKGMKYFDLKNWSRGFGGSWMKMYVEDGEFHLI